jgi:hypothetical protein
MGWAVPAAYPGKSNVLFLLQNVQTGYGEDIASCSKGAGVLSRV